MQRRSLILAVVALAVLSGCRGPAEVQPIALQDRPPQEQPAQPQRATEPWDVLAEAMPLEEPEDTRFYAAADAPKCPTIEVVALTGEEKTLKPGQAGYAEPGAVTLVVFWNMDTPQAAAAAKHVSDLARKYRRWRVMAIGIVERTRSAAVSVAVADRQALAFSLYYDDLSALGRMSKRAGAQERAAVPSVFIIDRAQRLRFYRGGFRFYATAVLDESGQRVEQIGESAPAGSAIEDYLKEILSEG